jgi:flagellar hook protein FlgE
MAITGDGFFQVRDRVTNELMYTRAGNFTWDSNGLLETPAGYVLQGWQLSIPKPGEDPVRLGVPVDVKVIAMNAPPVETSQIKVVANLNSDDTSAYIYSQSAWAGMYADELAKIPAEAARSAASKSVYDFSTQGSAYLNSSSTFNKAYLEFMSAQGFHPTSATSLIFEKTETVNPSTTEMNQAMAKASASAWAWLEITGPYPISDANSLLYETAYNSAYSNYMKNIFGYSEYPDGTFYKVTRTPATSAQHTVANGQAMNAATAVLPGYPGYPSGDGPADAVYATVYQAAMASMSMTPPVDEFKKTATGDTLALAAANTAGLTANGNVTYPSTTDGLANLQYAAAYAAELTKQGYTVDAIYPKPTVPDIVKYPTTAQLNNALTSAENSVGGVSWGSLINESDKLLYAATYVVELEQLGYSTSYTLDLPDPATGWTTQPLGSTQENTADLAGLTANGNIPYGGIGSTPLSDHKYLLEYVKSIKLSYSGIDLDSSTPPVTEPVQTDFTRAPSPTEITDAQAEGNAAAQSYCTSVGKTWSGYSTSTDDVANLAYIKAYTESLVTGGVITDSEYEPSPPNPNNPGPAGLNSGMFYKAPTQAQTSAAIQAGKDAVAALPDAPTGYAYPTGNTTLDDAYRNAYNAYLGQPSPPGLGYISYDSADYQKYYRVTQSHPDATQITQADTAAKTAAATAIGPDTTGYPLTTIEPGFGTAYNTAYFNAMSALGYDLISPLPLSPPYFEKTVITTATSADHSAAQTVAKTNAELAAKNAGQKEYEKEYQKFYQQAMDSITGQYAPWQLEGNGFAGAWDGTDLSSPIDPENYTHANPWTIYDSLGNAHTLMVYYQPNPNMENVWDYIITCDPTEDARKDVNNRLVMEGATFAGIIQKGKITFTADGPDRHGGVVKDIEAQNINMSATAAAVLTSASAYISAPLTASSLNYAKLDGYYTGKPVFSASTGTLVASSRKYTLEWVGNLGTVPDVSGFTWIDDAGNKGTIPIYDKNYTGPYTFGSGLNVSFTEGGKPMSFSTTDKLEFVAHSEAIGWTNLSPNEVGYFDFDVAFVQSASMALHPPYPEGLPTIIQHISLDMGARNPSGESGKWILDEQGTTQYASESINIFSSQDGYPAGSLQRVSIDKDGILTGIYTNGRHQPLYQIGLTRFINPWGLAKLGDNVYMETRWSGVGTINPPGYGGTGTIRANFLEQSNTDLADEIVNMIVTQRGFQANSKVVTTTDTMLAEVIEMKR